jgi:hypothetical protein
VGADAPGTDLRANPNPTESNASGGAAGLPTGGAGHSVSTKNPYNGVVTVFDGGGGGNNLTGQGGAGATGVGGNGQNGGASTRSGPAVGGAAPSTEGGGGGGGYYSGGGGSADTPGAVATTLGTGGGGGSDFCGSSVASGVSLSNCAVDSGAGTHSGSGSSANDAHVTFTYNSSATLTTLTCSATAYRLSDSMSCSAGVSGATSPPVTPTGSLTYTVYQNYCTGSAVASSTVAVAGDGSVPSVSDFAPGLAAGQYAVQAAYNGDGLHDPSVSGCVVVSIGDQTGTSLTCTLNAWPVGGSTSCQAVVDAEGSSPEPTGDVVYQLDSGPSCNPGSALGSTVYDQLAADGTVPATTLGSTLAAGFYSIQAGYVGDGNYEASLSDCQLIDVGPPAPSISTQVVDELSGGAWSDTEAAGAIAYDTATMAETDGLTPTGTANYELFDNGSCSGTPASSDTVTINADGTLPESGYSGALAAGDYSYQVSYDGDGVFGPGTSACKPFSVGAAVTPGPVIVSEVRLTGETYLQSCYVDLYNDSSAPVDLAGWTLDWSAPVSAGGATGSLALNPVTLAPGGHYLIGCDLYSVLVTDTVSADQDLIGSGSPQGLSGVSLVEPDGVTVSDSVGYTGSPHAAGTGLSVPKIASGDGSPQTFVRRFADGVPIDTGDNSDDFQYVSGAFSSDASQVYGLPTVYGTSAPSNTSSPRQINAVAQSFLVDPSVAQSAEPNMTYTPPCCGLSPGQGGTPGILVIQRAITNVSTDQMVTDLQLRMTGLSTYGEQSDPRYGVPGDPSAAAILQDVSSGADGGAVGLSLTSASGGLNSTLRVPLPTQSSTGEPGLAPGQTIDVAIEFDVWQAGQYAFAYNLEDDLEPYTPVAGAAPTSAPSGAAVSASVSGSVNPTGASAASPAASPTSATAAAGVQLKAKKTKAKKTKAKKTKAKKTKTKSKKAKTKHGRRKVLGAKGGSQRAPKTRQVAVTGRHAERQATTTTPRSDGP